MKQVMRVETKAVEGVIRKGWCIFKEVEGLK